MINLYTIGFTGKSAEHFFSLLKKNKVSKIIDTRINSTSQLSGFAKEIDLKFFAKALGPYEYEHLTEYAPTKELLTKYRKKMITWEEYEIEYLNLLDLRKISRRINISGLNDACLLCSEHTPDRCHRRLLAEYIKQSNSDVKITHLIK